MTRLLLICAVVAVALGAISTTAQANLQYPLHYGNKGRAVCAAQWLESGRGAPSVYLQRWFRVWKLPVRQDVGCVFGVRMVKATIGMKWKLGYCPHGRRWKDRKGHRHYCVIDGKFDYRLRNFLTGKSKRTWAMQRASLLRHYPPKHCTVASRVQRVARHEIGVREVPYGSNWGVRVAQYLAATGLRYPAFWCAAFAQWVLKQSGIGPVADRSAGVGYISYYARRHGWLRSDVKRGYLIAWGSSHIGVIDLVTGTGTYVVEGNSSNAVSRRFYRTGYLGGTLIKVPGLDRRIRCGT